MEWELRDFSDFKKSEIKDYQNVIFGSAVYIGKMNQIKKVLSWFKNKPTIIFACAGNNNDPKEINVIKKYNFAEEQLLFHHFFYLPGGVDYSKVKGFLKMMITFLQKILMKKTNLTAEEKELLNTFSHPTNYVAIEQIQDLVSYAKNME